MALKDPYFSSSFDRVRSMKTVDLTDMFNQSVIGLGNALIGPMEEADVEPATQPDPTLDPFAPENLGDSGIKDRAAADERESLFRRRSDEAFLLRQQGSIDPYAELAPSPVTPASEPTPMGPPAPTTVRANSQPTSVSAQPTTTVVAKDLTSFVKEFEGYNPKAFSDYKQISIGYGTRAKPGEKVISRDEAERRLAAELANSRRRVDAHAQKHGYQFSQKQLDALTSFDYNTGRLEQLTGGGSRPPEVIAQKMLLYNKAGGKTLPGLVRRRKAESSLFQSP
jgi:GH24 family phage-related lysozyme (muramidase)